jgi:hypothetical protein
MPTIIELILEELKKSSNLKNLDDDFLRKKIKNYFLREGKNEKLLKENYEKIGAEKICKNKIFKVIVKQIKEEINHVYTIFLTSTYKKKEKYLEENDIEELLKIHKSTRERIDFYEEIYKKIFNWYKPEKIADLACGMNPLSYNIICEILNYKPDYFASDLSFSDMKFIKKFFEKKKIKMAAKHYDLTEEKFLKEKELKNSDLVFLFKALDSIEEVKRHYSKILIEKLSAKKIVVSFPTKSIGCKQNFTENKRNWFYKFLEKMNWKYETFQIENELFFLIDKR